MHIKSVTDPDGISTSLIFFPLPFFWGEKREKGRGKAYETSKLCFVVHTPYPHSYSIEIEIEVEIGESALFFFLHIVEFHSLYSSSHFPHEY